MKSVWNSFKAAFAMFSKIPTPMVDWNKENMKYMMCFFPFVGTAIGILIWLVGCVLGSHAQMEPFFLAVILTVIPVFVTGGIHVDGLLDTSDALSSWQERTRRLEILKDSHAGAFAIITACVYFILWLGAWSQLLGDHDGICIMSIGFMMSRCLSGIGVIIFPKARTDGTVAEFSRNASEIVARNVLIVNACSTGSTDDMDQSGKRCACGSNGTAGILVVSSHGYEIFWRNDWRSFRFFPLYL